MRIPIKYIQFHDELLLEHALIITIAKDRSPKWREFLKHGPILEPKWFNEIVDFMITTYPQEFMLSPN